MTKEKLQDYKDLAFKDRELKSHDMWTSDAIIELCTEIDKLNSELSAIREGEDVEYDNRGANGLALRMIELIDDKEKRTGVFGGETIEKLAKKIDNLKSQIQEHFNNIANGRD